MRIRNIATLAMLTIFFITAESQAAVERYKIEADYLARIAELGHSTVVEGFESSAWDSVRSPDVNNLNSSPGVLSQGVLWEPASVDVFGPGAFVGVTTNHNWARSGTWGMYEVITPLLYPTAVRVSSTDPIYGVGGWFNPNPDTESVGFLFEDATTANTPGYVLPGLGAFYPGDNAGPSHRFVGIVDPDGFDSVVLAGTLEINEEGVLEGGAIYGADDFTFAVGSVATADFNGDGDVDGDDLTDPTLGWVARFGVDLDGSDFLAWQQQFTSPGPLAVTTVPEPSGMFLFGCFVFAGMAFCPRFYAHQRRRTCQKYPYLG